MNDRYESPLSARYASSEMQYLFSLENKILSFRRLWIALARAEKENGVPISDGQISEMEEHLYEIDYEKGERYEEKLRHDVMAQIHAFGDLCPTARPIIHLGATSCYVGDNTDILIMKKGLALLRTKICKVLENLSDFALKWKDEPCLAYTHLQPAQLTTVGKRATLWMYDLTLDLADLDYVSGGLALLGSKGTTGTQASFAELFAGDEEKVKRAEASIAEEMGFDKVVPVSGQTYTRKIDYRAMSVLSGIAQSVSKFATDLRLLQSFKEIEEPFEKNQVGSSAMPYKRNPMRSERICGLARALICDAQNAAFTEASQWMERTLDDSSNKRLSISEGFLLADAILNLYINVTGGLKVYPKVIERRVMAELPFMASENILMDAVMAGKDRQDLHEAIRQHAMEAGKRVKEEGLDNDLLERVSKDERFGLDEEKLKKALDPHKYVGLAPSQTEEFVKNVVRPLLAGAEISEDADIKV